MSAFVLFSLLLAESLSLLKCISCHGNDVIVCKTIYCPWKGIHDETERQHVLKRDPTESSHVRTQISKPWFQSTPPPPPSCGPVSPKSIRKAAFLATYTKYTPNKISGLMLEETIDALKFPHFSLGWEKWRGWGADGRLRIRMVCRHHNTSDGGEGEGRSLFHSAVQLLSEIEIIFRS